MTNTLSTETDLELLARKLEASPDFRVLRRLVIKDHYGNPDGRALSKGIVIDTETTGLRHDQDKIIEIGLVVFEFDKNTGEVFRILESFNALEDPHMPIPSDSTAVHGITDAMVAGKRFDEAKVNSLVQDADIIIAHNSGFDRPFLERRFPIFAKLAWGCSFAQVDWSALGFTSQKLEFIAHQCGFFFDAHRAEMDCRALLEVLQFTFPGAPTRPLKFLLDSYLEKNFKVWARGSRFETKDMLKERGYRWDGEEKCWYTNVSETALDGETAWLKSNVYGKSSATVEFEMFDAYDRFSHRGGKRTRSR